MRAQLDIPDALAWHGLDAALHGLQSLAELEVAEGDIPPLYESGVAYRREPRGSERWLVPSLVLDPSVGAGWGDCEDLAAWRAAELRVTGEDPDAAAQVVRSGRRTWHAVVRRGDGTFEDPSAVLGMHQPNGMRAPVRFMLDPLDGGRSYRARLDVTGFGHTEHHESEADCPSCALRGALDSAGVSELGQIPVVSPLLQMFSSMLSPAAAARPGTAPTRPGTAPAAAPTPPTFTVPAGFESLLPSAEDLDVSLIRLASQLRSLVRREARRARRRR